MALCDFDDNLTCRWCGYRAREPKTKRRCNEAPTFAARLSKYGESLARWIAAGRPVRSQERIDQLLAEHCGPCPKFVDGQCSSCGCRVNRSPRGWMNKLAMATESCPLDQPRWAAESCEPSRAIKVGFVLPVLQCGGVERWHISMCQAMSKCDGVEVVGVACTGPAELVDASLAAELGAIVPLFGRRECDGMHFFPRPNESAAVVAQAADVVVAWSISGPTIDVLRGARKPIVGMSHGCGDWWMREAAPHVSHWVAVSEAAASPIPGGVAIVLANGIDLNRLKPTLTRAEVRHAAGIPLDARLVVSVGRLAREKRLDLLASAMRHLSPDTWLWLVGDGNQADQICNAAGEAVGRLRIDPSRRDVGNVLAASDCFAFCSESEGYGLAPVESLAAGLPLVSTPVGILPDLGDVAELVPLDPTPAELARAIQTTLGRPDAARIDRARELVRRDHSADAMARRWADYLRSIVAIPR